MTFEHPRLGVARLRETWDSSATPVPDGPRPAPSMPPHVHSWQPVGMERGEVFLPDDDGGSVRRTYVIQSCACGTVRRVEVPPSPTTKEPQP